MGRKYGDRGYDACGDNTSTSCGGTGSDRDYHPLSRSTIDSNIVRQAVCFDFALPLHCLCIDFALFGRQKTPLAAVFAFMNLRASMISLKTAIILALPHLCTTGI